MVSPSSRQSAETGLASVMRAGVEVADEDFGSLATDDVVGLFAVGHSREEEYTEVAARRSR